MKKLLSLLAIGLVAIACGPKHWSYEDIELDYPSMYKVSHEDVDEDLVTIMIDDDISSSIDFIFFEITSEDPEEIDGADPEVLAAYLAHHAYRVVDIMKPDEKISFSKDLESEDDIDAYQVDDGEQIEVKGTLEGIHYDEPFYGVVYSTVFDKRYRITAYAQASKPEYLKTLEDIYHSVHLKKQ